jgi:hypothetical protein
MLRSVYRAPVNLSAASMTAHLPSPAKGIALPPQIEEEFADHFVIGLDRIDEPFADLLLHGGIARKSVPVRDIQKQRQRPWKFIPELVRYPHCLCEELTE